MRCLDANQLARLTAGEVAPEERAEIEAHLDACPDCRRTVAAMMRAPRSGISDEPTGPMESQLPVEHATPRLRSQ